MPAFPDAQMKLFLEVHLPCLTGSGNVGYSKLDESQTELIVLKTGDHASSLHLHYSMY